MNNYIHLVTIRFEAIRSQVHEVNHFQRDLQALRDFPKGCSQQVSNTLNNPIWIFATLLHFGLYRILPLNINGTEQCGGSLLNGLLSQTHNYFLGGSDHSHIKPLYKVVSQGRGHKTTQTRVL